MLEWVTNAGMRLEDSDVFRREAIRFEQGVRWLADILDPDSGDLSAAKIADAVSGAPVANRSEFFLTLAYACLVLTGQSDNALKCQFPVFLVRADAPLARRLLRLVPPSTHNPALSAIKMERVAQRISAQDASPDAIHQLVNAYFDCLFGRANMTRLRDVVTEVQRMDNGRATSLLEVMALSAIKGSATASGGHLPEEQLRLQMETWGLVRGTDFNTADVGALELASLSGRTLPGTAMQEAQKSRAFDFVFPYRIVGRNPKLLIQGQFYAGDSGSVSHKNVDQTPTGRSAARRVIHEPLFAEFLDGAGYVTALSGDAERLLAIPGTDGLLQLKTAIVRLRELLQRVDLATPIEVVHGVWLSRSRSMPEVLSILRRSYSDTEARRIVETATQLGWIAVNGDVIEVSESRAGAAFEIAVLDTIAIMAGSPGCERVANGLTIPGYGMHGWGISAASVRSRAAELLPGFPGMHLGSRLTQQ